MNIIDIFLILAISVITIEISSQVEYSGSVQELNKSSEEYREMVRNLKNQGLIGNEEHRENNVPLVGQVDPARRSYIGVYRGNEDLETVVRRLARTENVSRVFLRSGDRYFRALFHDQRVPYQTEPLGTRRPVQTNESKVIEFTHNNEKESFPFYSPEVMEVLERERPDTVRIQYPTGKRSYHKVFWHEKVKGSLKLPANAMNQTIRFGFREPKEIMSKSKYMSLFDSKDVPSSSEGSSSSRSDQKKKKGKKEAEEKE